METSHRRRFGVVYGIEVVGGWIEGRSSRRELCSRDAGNAGAGIDRVWPWGVEIGIDAAKAGLIAFPHMADWVAGDGVDRRSRQDLYRPRQVESLNHTYIGGCACDLRRGVSGRCKQGKNRKNQYRAQRCPPLEPKVEWSFPSWGGARSQTPHLFGLLAFLRKVVVRLAKPIKCIAAGFRKGGCAPRPCGVEYVQEMTGEKLCWLSTSRAENP